MTPLREQLLTDMRSWNLLAEVQERYILEVATLAKRTRKSPDLVAPDELAEFLDERREELPPAEFLLSVEAIRFFVTKTLGLPWQRATKPQKTTELQRRMTQDMRLKNLAPRTQYKYLRWVSKFAKFSGKSPLELGHEDIRKWLVNLVETEKMASGTCAAAASALKFLYTQTLGRQWTPPLYTAPKREERLPDILSIDEVATFLGVELTLREYAILSAIYAGGLRTAEVSRLKVTHIDSKRMTLKIVQGKGRKDRFVALSKRLLEDLRRYWVQYRPSTWLFPNPDGTGPISTETVRQICHRAVKKAGLAKKVTPRTLRHCFATHQLEEGESMGKIQLAMGHRSIRTTAVYTHLATSSVCAMESPLDRLPTLPD